MKARLGPAKGGWTKRKAEAELRHRLTAVECEGLRKIDAVTFGSFASEWLASYPDAKVLKRSTREIYETIVESHLRPYFGSRKLGSIDVQALERYVAAKRSGGLGPRTVNYV